MSATVATRQTNWQPDQVHEPAYQSPSDGMEAGFPGDEVEAPRTGGISIRQIRQSMIVPAQYSPPTSIMPSPPSSKFDSPPPPKKKNNIFSGLFGVKEPTQIALNQVAAQMIAQHGSTNPVKVPNVSIEKMPEYVPKVNSKWDGVPEAIKLREKWEKEQQRLAKKQGMNRRPSSGSGDGIEQDRRTSFSRDSYAGYDQYFLPVAGGSVSLKSSPQTTNPHKFYAQSVNSSGDLASQQRSPNPETSPHEQFQNLRSPGSASVSSMQVKATNNVPPRSPRFSMEGSGLAIANTRMSIDDERPDQAAPIRIKRPSMSLSIPEEIPPVPEIPKDIPTSPPKAPRQKSSMDNSYSQTSTDSEGSTSLDSSGPNVLPLPKPTKKQHKKQPSAGFLAGEARPFELPDDDDDQDQIETTTTMLPLRGSKKSAKARQSLEKRPDTSRNRLGLKVNMTLKPDTAPWENQESPSSTASISPSYPPKLARQLSARLPRSLSFGRDKK